MTLHDQFARKIGTLEQEIAELRALHAQMVVQSAGIAHARETRTLALVPDAPSYLTHSCISGACGQCFDDPPEAA